MNPAQHTGTLHVVATPIGNLEDLTDRARRVLSAVAIVCCEDTRHTGQLLAREQLRAHRLLSLHAHNEDQRVREVLEALASGEDVALVSDAGTPLVSDPGAHLVARCADAGVPIVAVPGPSAVLAALVVSGFATDRFRFEGFLPRKGSERDERLRAIAGATEVVVCYEAPGRVAATLADLTACCGAERRVAIARELTKVHEEVWRGPLASAAASPVATVAKGEYVLVLDGAAAPAPERDGLSRSLEQLAQAGLGRRDAVAAAEALLGVSHREAYDAALLVDFPTTRGKEQPSSR